MHEALIAAHHLAGVAAGECMLMWCMKCVHAAVVCNMVMVAVHYLLIQ